MLLKNEIQKAIKKINFRNYQTLYIVGNIFNFGFSFNDTKKFSEVFTKFKKNCKNQKSILVPTATLDLLKNKNAIFSKNSKSYRMGIFSEYIRLQKGCLRSHHPLWSFFRIGKNIKNIFDTNSCSAYGKNSVFERLLNANTLFISLGEPNKSIGMIHYAEHVVGVPYRFNKEFYVKKKFKNKIRKQYCILSVRFNSKKLEKQGNKKIIDILKKRKVFKKISLNKVIFMWLVIIC